MALRIVAVWPDAGALGRRAKHLGDALGRRAFGEPLTPAEKRVRELLPTHLSNEQMAARLHVSRNTIKTHLRAVYRKLDVASRAKAVERARSQGLLTN
jgi:ATP/maltotriose-dependent transcriptional regulator MalT